MCLPHGGCRSDESRDITELKRRIKDLEDAMQTRADETIKLQLELDSLRADADRYRFLRDDGYLDHYVSVHICDRDQTPKMIDEYIDRIKK